MRRRKFRGPCPICGIPSDLSKEDVFPTWLRGEYLKWHDKSKPRPPRVILRVCVACNEAMGDAFEDDAAPILKRFMWSSGSVSLTEREQFVLARWLVKTDALLAVYRGAAAKEGLLVMSEETDQLLLTMVRRMTADPHFLPPNAIVRLGRIDENLVLSSSQPFGSGRTPATIGDGWVNSVMVTGNIVTHTELLTDRGGDASEYMGRLDDKRFVLLAPPQEEPITVPLGLDVLSSQRMITDFGHRPSNFLGGGWAPRRDR